MMKILRLISISAAFGVTAVAITLVMWVLTVTGHELIPGHPVQDWLKQGMATVAYAISAGLLVDAARWFTVLVWRLVYSASARSWQEQHGAGTCFAE